MSRYAWLAVVGLAFSLCGCVLDKPLSDPKTAKVDERLLGRWVGVNRPNNPDAEGSLLWIGRHAVKGNPEGIMEGLAVGYDDKDQMIVGDSPSVSYFSITKVGSVDMLNVFYEEVPIAPGKKTTTARPADLSHDDSYAAWSESPSRSSFLFRYVFDGDQLKFYLVDLDKLEALAKAGELKKQGELITAESLAAYIEKNGADGLFVGDADMVAYKKAK